MVSSKYLPNILLLHFINNCSNNNNNNNNMDALTMGEQCLCDENIAAAGRGGCVRTDFPVDYDFFFRTMLVRSCTYVLYIFTFRRGRIGGENVKKKKEILLK